MKTKHFVAAKDAKKVYNAVKAQHAAYLAAGYEGPTLVKDWDWTGYGPAPWAVVWEGGPYEWAVQFPDGGVDEELTALLADAYAENGLDPTKAKATVKDVRDKLPKGVYTEPVTGWALGIYPA